MNDHRKRFLRVGFFALLCRELGCEPEEAVALVHDLVNDAQMGLVAPPAEGGSALLTEVEIRSIKAATPRAQRTRK